MNKGDKIEIEVPSCTSEEFYISLFSTLNSISFLIRPSDVLILAILCTKSDSEGIVLLSSSTRKEIETKIKYSAQNFSNSLTRLKQSGIVKGEGGKYELFLEKLFKGTIEERKDILTNNSTVINLKFFIDDYITRVQ